MLCSKQGGSPTWTNFVVSFLTTNKTTNVHHPSESTALGLRFCVNTFGNSKTSMMNPRTYQQHVWDSFLGSLRFSIPKSPKHSKKVKSPARPGSPHENPKAGLGRPRLRSAPDCAAPQGRDKRSKGSPLGRQEPQTWQGKAWCSVEGAES
jgi:hypothetical protein